jgi:hypothetical protein
MDNLARVIMVTLQPGAIIPCIRALRGIEIASRTNGAPFKIVMTFSYPVGAGRASVSSTVLINETQHVAILEPQWSRMQAPAVPITQPVEPGSQIRCTAKITIQDAAGAVVDCGNVETTNLTPVGG